ncbi:hypothetical protein DL769_002211 [Monosporascus sp. CRB-8-3]|nr:hypothetical protein DL769_002211 [Monosporascus sp. CRB-8-3]
MRIRVRRVIEVPRGVVQRAHGGLAIGVVVPGHDAAVTAPAEQRAVREPDPRLTAHGEVGAYEEPQRGQVLLLWYLPPPHEVPLVVLPELLRAPRLAGELDRVHLSRHERVAVVVGGA